MVIAPSLQYPIALLYFLHMFSFPEIKKMTEVKQFAQIIELERRSENLPWAV